MFKWKPEAIDAACSSFSVWWDVCDKNEMGAKIKEQIRQDVSRMLDAASKAQELEEKIIRLEIMVSYLKSELAAHGVAGTTKYMFTGKGYQRADQ